MADNSVQNTTTTNMSNIVDDFIVSPKLPDVASPVQETYYDNPNFSTYFGYYKTIPELKRAIDAMATYTVGKGFDTDSASQIVLEHVGGNGKQTIDEIFWDMLVIAMVNGDAYAEIIRDDNADPQSLMTNLKVLDPSTFRVVYNSSGMVIRYEQRNRRSDGSENNIKWEPNQIFHITNDRVADETHGTSVIESCKWVIDARNEAMSDWRRISHRSTIRVLYVDIDDNSRLATLKTQWADAIANGEVLLLPVKRADAELADYTLPPVDAFLQWIKYLENFFYQAVGIPKIILGGSEEFTEAGSKIALLTFDQKWKTMQNKLENAIWNQLYIKLNFVEPVSIKNELVTDEQKNTGQTNIQPNATQAGVGQ